MKPGVHTRTFLENWLKEGKEKNQVRECESFFLPKNNMRVSGLGTEFMICLAGFMAGVLVSSFFKKGEEVLQRAEERKKLEEVKKLDKVDVGSFAEGLALTDGKDEVSAVSSSIY